MGKKKESRKDRQEARSRAAKRKQNTVLIMIAGGVLILAVSGWTLWKNNEEAAAAFDYSPQDVSYDQPLEAVHEMDQGPPIPFLPSSGLQPQIAFNESYYNFGSIGPTDVVTHDFVVANLGEAPLTISRAYTTCGCTTAQFTSAVIPPGMVSEVTIELDAGMHDVRGQTVRRGLIIESNDPKQSTTEIWVQATVRQE